MDRLGDVLFGPSVGADPDRRAMTTASVWVAAMTFLACLAVAFSLPALYGNDERGHLAYVDRLAAGQLPTIDTQVPADPELEVLSTFYGPDGGRDWGGKGDVWVANHPPLTYVLALGPARLLSALGLDKSVAMVLRVLSAAGMAIGVLATVAVAAALRPGQHRLAVVAAVVVGLTPLVLGVGGQGLTDGIAFAIGTALLACVLRIVRSGPGPLRLAALAGLAGLAALTKASLLPLIALAALTWLVVAWPRRHLALAGAAAVAAVPVLVAGWFYARNIDLYGDPTASEHLLTKFGRLPRHSTLSILVQPSLLLGMWQEMWGTLDFTTRLGTGGIHINEMPDLGSTLLIGGSLALVALVGVVRALRRSRPRFRRPDVAVWGVALAWIAILLVSVASFVSEGGTPHPRYLLPVHSITVVLLVAAVIAVGGVPRATRWLVGSLGFIDLLLLARLRVQVEAWEGLLYDPRLVVDPLATSEALRWPSWTQGVVVAAALGAAAAAVRALSLASGAPVRVDPGGVEVPEVSSVGLR